MLTDLEDWEDWGEEDFKEVEQEEVYKDTTVTRLDLTSSLATSISEAVAHLATLTHLYLSNNRLVVEDIPSLASLTSLHTINLSSNLLTSFPLQVATGGLRNLFLGGNQLREVPGGVRHLTSLQVLCIEDNRLQQVSADIGHLSNLQVLLLNGNNLSALPTSLSLLSNLQVLHLHHNLLPHLPHGLSRLPHLGELTLRANPLITRFIRSTVHQPCTLVELASRVVRSVGVVEVAEGEVPATLVTLLEGGSPCTSPTCSSTYFTQKVDHVRFTDLCGRTKVPLLQHLCSSRCGGQEAKYSHCDLVCTGTMP